MAARTPTVLQMEVVECGAASLSMVLSHHGRHVPLEELRLACGVSRDGSTASNVVRAARSYGLAARGIRTRADQLADHPMPMILFWERKHFLVLDGFVRRFGRTYARLNDPARGRRTLRAEEFEASYSGIALTMRPGEDFRRGGRRRGVLAGLPARLSGMTGLLGLAMTAGLLLAVVGVANPALLRAFVDSVFVRGDHSVLGPVLGMLVVTLLVTGLLTALQQGFLLRARIVGGTLGSVRFVHHLLRLPAVFFGQRGQADLGNRVRFNDDVASVLSKELSGLAVNVLMILFYGSLLWTYNPFLTVLSVGIALAHVAAMRIVTQVRAAAVDKADTDEVALMSASYHGLRTIETIKASGGEEEYYRRWAGALAKVVSSHQKIGGPTAVLAAVGPVLAIVNTALILLIGGLQAVEGLITVGALVAFQAFTTAFTSPLTQVVGVAGKVQDFAVKVARLRDVENFPAEGSDRTERPVASLDGHLVFEDVTFGYAPLDDPLLREVSFTVRPGEQLALVGRSGSGKSTVTRLLAGQYQPWRGRILIDGVPREELARHVLAADVAFVDQDVFLFEGTVRDNITLWDSSIPDDDVVAALQDAAVYEAVAARSGGIHSRIAEDGRDLSGGQRQRLEIARALVRRPRLLVLDEATSALDTATERHVMASVRRRGCATVVVAHRLSTVRDSDEILVLERGVVVERGTHDDLVTAGGPYSALIRER
ncbi:NHLP family bacteriocin export ABC transporter peptidase/permease/ATPase subunit [Lentzea alba]|uniref:NHLP family bacteriocin export ABC transporter peptidase/permease/ATPase subunit n=1 Tax=Lentzea alba TaxID=2714351 RepID=UPI0039BEE2D0